MSFKTQLTEVRRQEMARLLLVELAKSGSWESEYPSGDTNLTHVTDKIYECVRVHGRLPGKLFEVILRFSKDRDEALSFGEPLAATVLERDKQEKKKVLRHAA